MVRRRASVQELVERRRRQREAQVDALQHRLALATTSGARIMAQIHHLRNIIGLGDENICSTLDISMQTLAQFDAVRDEAIQPYIESVVEAEEE